LLDTDALLWWLDGDAKLSPTARTAIGNNSPAIWASVATVWEIATNVRIGKLPEAAEAAARLPEILSEQFLRPWRSVSGTRTRVAVCSTRVAISSTGR
jgi:PIN domain nuclease of toxin-antitoxin system